MPKVPYGAILRDISIWGVWIASIGGTFGFQIFFQYGPVYINEVSYLNFARKHNPDEKARWLMFRLIVGSKLKVLYVI